jgi:hypothetical protein
MYAYSTFTPLWPYKYMSLRHNETNDHHQVFHSKPFFSASPSHFQLPPLENLDWLYQHQLIINYLLVINHSIFFMMMTLKCTELLTHLVIVYFYSQILIVYTNGIQQTLWSLTLVKLVISFTRKMNMLSCQYRFGNCLILQTDFIKDLDICIDCKLHFHHHVYFLFSHSVILLGLISTITFFFSTIDSLLMLYIALVTAKLEHASVTWNSDTIYWLQ